MNKLGLDPRIDHMVNLQSTLQWWITNGQSVNSPVTWDNIITVIEGPVQNYELAREMHFVMSKAATNDIKPQKAFLCPCGSSPSHVCIANVHENVTNTCSHTKQTRNASKDESSWFDHKGTNLYSKPRIGDLVRVLAPVAPKYSTIGICLHVPMDKLGLDPRNDHMVNLQSTLQWWITNGPSVNSPVTWDNIITVIEGPVQNYELAREMHFVYR
jgi:hypothetical protein